METAYKKDKKISERLHMISEVLVHSDLLRPIQKRVLNLIPAALFVTISSSLAIGFYLTSIDQYHDLGINILVELGGIFFTIYIVGFFFNKHEHVKNVPFRVMAWKQIANVFDRHFLVWKTAYQKTGVKMYGGPEDFLNRESFLEMMMLLDLNQPVEKGRDLTWGQMIQKVAIATQRDLMYAQNAHGHFLDSKFIIDIHEFLESDFTGSLLELSKINKLRRSHKHSFYNVSLKPSNNYFNNMKKIYEWLITEKASLLMHSYDQYLVTSLYSRYF